MPNAISDNKPAPNLETLDYNNTIKAMQTTPAQQRKDSRIPIRDMRSHQIILFGFAIRRDTKNLLEGMLDEVLQLNILYLEI